MKGLLTTLTFFSAIVLISPNVLAQANWRPEQPTSSNQKTASEVAQPPILTGNGSASALDDVPPVELNGSSGPDLNQQADSLRVGQDNDIELFQVTTDDDTGPANQNADSAGVRFRF
ncbi:MAG: hypothetical protein F6K19_38100 [Cyanothece sp. SIO1E1]|nr:hypothetical protein [Cyanothece sp. SIO1E1]